MASIEGPEWTPANQSPSKGVVTNNLLTLPEIKPCPFRSSAKHLKPHPDGLDEAIDFVHDLAAWILFVR